VDDRSLSSCSRASADYADAWNNICAGYNKLGRYEEAAAACEQVLRYKSDFELAHNNLQYARKMAKALAK
jgi:tetratricopeptide (TPR) repeat protein